jgi:hypothetical protein
MHELRPIIISILQRKTKASRNYIRTEGHTASKKQSQGENLHNLTPESLLSISLIVS